MIAAYVRRRTQRIALFLIFVVLADFGADDGCDCSPDELTHASAVTITNHRPREVTP